jgi:tetratricopeptide (TPR) repeat protein
MYDEAIAEFQRAIELSGHSGAFDSNLAHVYAVSGRKEEATKIVKDLEARDDQNPSIGADMKRDSKRPSCCARPSILCGPTLDSKISGAVSASRHES